MENAMVVQQLPLSDIERMGAVMASSKMFGFKTIEEAVALMLIAQAEGNHPAMAAQEYNVIMGRPALKADAMMARFQKAGGIVEWEEMTDDVVSAYFSHPKSCPKPVKVDWTMERAKQAKLTGKDNWTKYPRQMLKARVISEGVRMTYPGVTVGLYTPEEVEQFDEDKSQTRMVGHAQAAEVITSKIASGDVPHISKTDTIAEEIRGEKLYNGKPKGDIDVTIKKIAATDTVRGAKSVVTRAFNKYAFTKKERDAITESLDWHCDTIATAHGIAEISQKERDEQKEAELNAKLEELRP